MEYFPGVHISGSTNLPLWNNPAFRFTLSDKTVRRLDKVRYLVEDDFPLDHLRVCHRRPVNALNCGRCEKCIRTMLNLEAHGALKRCTTFAAGLDPAFIRHMTLTNDTKRKYMQRNLEALTEAGGQESAIIKAVHKTLDRPQWQQNAIRWYYRIRKRLFGSSRN